MRAVSSENRTEQRSALWALIGLAAVTGMMMAGMTVDAAETPKKKMGAHAHVAGDGVTSIDVFAERGRTVRQKGADKPPILEYQRSEDGGGQWSEPQPIASDDLPPPVGAHRGMDVQLAAAGKHVVAAWTIYSADTRFGRGKIATAVSADGGKTWRAGPNPADDGSDGDHAFLDLAADQRGAFHAVWLDSRSGKKGLIYTNSSDGGATWSRNVILDHQSCECCWNTVTTVGDKVLVLYRDQNPRDMAMISSADGGKTWATPTAVGAFQWDFDGCPHVGGGLAATTAGSVFATVWTGKTDVVGAYLLSSPDGGKSWNAPLRLGDANSIRSDVAAEEQQVVAVWDTMTEGKGAVFAAASSDGGKTWSPPAQISAASASATHPRVVRSGSGFCAFWTESSEGKPDAWRMHKL